MKETIQEVIYCLRSKTEQAKARIEQEFVIIKELEEHAEKLQNALDKS